jgi:chemotaxis protein MotA
MDLATIIGLVLGIWLIMAAIGGGIGSFIDLPSVYIVCGGAFASTLMSLPLRRVLLAPKVIKNAFLTKKRSNDKLVAEIVRYGEIARRDGILALEAVLGEIDDAFLARAVQLAVDGSDPEVIAETLQAEMDNLSSRHKSGKRVLDLVGKYAPAYGMIGTLIGLVLMLNNLADSSKIGPSMAVALLTTLYGALMSYLIANPMADKLELRSEEELQRMRIVSEGIIAIQSGDNPKIVGQKLQIFLPPAERILA